MTIPIAARPVSMRHLITLTDDRGIFEHARFAQPRYGHGYCTDDNARLLIVTARDEGRTFASRSLAQIALQFLLDAQHEDGTIRNRMSIERIWLDEACTHDCWGRSVWAFGVSASRNHHNTLRQKSLEGFERAAQARSVSLRSMCFAALGAAAVSSAQPHSPAALGLLRDVAAMLRELRGETAWTWPEARLTYANAVVPDAMMAAGNAIGDRQLVDRGLDLLQWLVAHESLNDHLSVTPVGGRGPGDPKPAFDQQPIEVSTIADAVVRAYHLTGDAKWRVVLDRAVHWFLGHNDVGASMIDPVTDGGFDALTPTGVNENQGAESTLAMISTMQYAATNGRNGG
ncbi:MAG: hypothetical protein RL383_440 [Actinomycetota bacterium]